ncbi:hypothetical protein [Shewanella atlantica]|uniref:DUF998 domain-containing protein n=1 Tax=Shewanella atlantica TaxID=271099 RepID=A0A3S0KK97_9GAMM|nr:hypothetical protein [Shewanella atlantica]RTR32825.1 hypothetical protein EKG39_10690 [Shewanella atlantica]
MIEKSVKLSSLAFKFGTLGIVGLLMGVILSALGFQDFEGHNFNFFNHTLSELGHYGHSTFAVVINGGLFFGSLSLILFCLFSIQLIDSKLLYSLFLSLVLTFMSLAAAGLFPVNVYHLHTMAIKYFFYFGSFSSFLYLVYLSMKGRLFYSSWNAVTGILTFISFLCFLVLSHIDLGLIAGDKQFYQEMVMELPRPDIWWPATLEWLSLTLFMLWGMGMVQSLRNQAQIKQVEEGEKSKAIRS